MTTHDTDGPQPRPLASYETGFWASLEYPAFWMPVLGLTFALITAASVLLFVR